MDEEQKTLLACLGACAPEGFTLQTAQVVSEQDEVVAGRGLGRLLRLSILDAGTQANRYAFHPLLLLFSRELAREHSMLTIAEQRHTDYFIKYAHEHRGLTPENIDALEQELDALLLTARRLINDKIADYEYYFSLEPFLQTSGSWSQGLELIRGFLQVVHVHDDYRAVAQLLLQRAQFLQLLGRFDETELALQES